MRGGSIKGTRAPRPGFPAFELALKPHEVRRIIIAVCQLRDEHKAAGAAKLLDRAQSTIYRIASENQPISKEIAEATARAWGVELVEITSGRWAESRRTGGAS